MTKFNVLVKKPKTNNAPCMFIGRYQPLHKGHIKLMRTVLDEGKDIVIALRDTDINENNPYTVKERIKMIKKEFPDAVVYPNKGRVTICAIPDLSEITFGRGVGYGVRQIELDKETESISATKIRNKIQNGD